MDWYLKVLKQYADFTGRARRTEYWMFQLINMLFLFGIMCVVAVLFAIGQIEGVFSNIIGGLLAVVFILYIFAVFIPSLAVTVRRLHDTNKSGWLILLDLIPYIGGLVIFIFTLLDSDYGPNQYGPNPKGIGNVNVEEFDSL